jgi:predicted dehydrogenase
MVRWLIDLDWPKRISSSGGILVDRASRANIPDTQTAVFDYDELQVVWQHRTWGAPPDPKYQWGATLYGDKGTLKASVFGFDFTPIGQGQPISREVRLELDEFPEDKTEKDLERHVAPALRRHLKDFLSAVDNRSRPVADIEEGHISSASCILANVALELGRTLTWDPVSGRVIGDQEANRLLRRPYRAPWVHPEPASV